jgi:hypothetical protein
MVYNQFLEEGEAQQSFISLQTQSGVSFQVSYSLVGNCLPAFLPWQILTPTP